MAKILVTPRSLTQDGHPALKRLTDAGHDLVFAPAGRQPTEEELLQLLPGCQGYLAGVERICARVLEAAPGLEVISRNGTGVDNIDLAAAERLGTTVCRAEGANARGVAELTIALMLALVRSIPRSDARLKSGRWERTEGIEVEGKPLGLVGCGRVGKKVAELALALGMSVVAYDPAPDGAFQPSPQFRYASLDDVLAEGDVISLHCPPLPQGRPLIDGAAILKMRPSVYLVNTARASLLDRDAVLAGLTSGRIAGAAVDVFAEEPPADDPLTRHPRVIATPHIGGYTAESVSRAVEAAVDALLGHLAKPPAP